MLTPRAPSVSIMYCTASTGINFSRFPSVGKRAGTTIPSGASSIDIATSSQFNNIGHDTQSRNTFSGKFSFDVVTKPHFSKKRIARVNAKIVLNLRSRASATSAFTSFCPTPPPRNVSSTASERSSTSAVLIGTSEPQPATHDGASASAPGSTATSIFFSEARMLVVLRGSSPPLRALLAINSEMRETSSRTAGRTITSIGVLVTA